MVLLGCYAEGLLLRTEVSDEFSAFFKRVIRIGEPGTTLAVTSNRLTLGRNSTQSCHPEEGGAKFLRNVGV
jgi:hypothetical protein